MKFISHEMIANLKINPQQWYEWADYVLRNKHLYTMPPKISIHFGESYFNTMPGILPTIGWAGCKNVNRYIGRVPSVESQILLYDYTTGILKAIMDGSMITAMRTGAVTIHAMELYANPDFYEVGIMGLGNVGTACMEVLCSHHSSKKMRVKILRYKDHAEKIIDRYKENKNIDFEIVDSIKELICGTDVIISSITYTDELLGQDEWFKEGCLVIPVHLRGFQNCDLFFDKVFGDDYDQVKNFKYFGKFKYFAETSEVLRGEKVGRRSHSERILSYNGGISLHDIYAASQIYKMIKCATILPDLSPQSKYWL